MIKVGWNDRDTPEVLDMQDRLAERGLYAMYGGDKGHGFWIAQTTPEWARYGRKVWREFCANRSRESQTALTGWFSKMNGVVKSIHNDGAASGNPSFWMWDDAEKLADGDMSAICGG